MKNYCCLRRATFGALVSRCRPTTAILRLSLRAPPSGRTARGPTDGPDTLDPRRRGRIPSLATMTTACARCRRPAEKPAGTVPLLLAVPLSSHTRLSVSLPPTPSPRSRCRRCVFRGNLKQPRRGRADGNGRKSSSRRGRVYTGAACSESSIVAGTFVLIKGSSKLKVMICRNISMPAPFRAAPVSLSHRRSLSAPAESAASPRAPSRSLPPGKWSHYGA